MGCCLCSACALPAVYLSSPYRIICGIVACAYLFCQRWMMVAVKRNRLTAKLLATESVLGVCPSIRLSAPCTLCVHAVQALRVPVSFPYTLGVCVPAMKHPACPCVPIAPCPSTLSVCMSTLCTLATHASTPYTPNMHPMHPECPYVPSLHPLSTSPSCTLFTPPHPPWVAICPPCASICSPHRP